MDFIVGFQAACLGFFFLQGILYALLLAVQASRHDHPPSWWLSLFLLLCCLYITPFMLGYQGWYGIDGYREFLFFVPFQQLFFLGPVMYFYLRSLLEGQHRLHRKDWWHLLPGGLYLAYSLLVFVVDVFVLDEFYFYADGRDKDLDSWYQVLGFSSITIYFIAGLRLYGRYRKRIFEELAYADFVLFNWVRQYVIILLVMASLRVVYLLVLPNFGSFGLWFWYYLVFSFLFCYVAISGYMNTLRLVTLARGNVPPSISAEPFDQPEESELDGDLSAGRAALLELMAGARPYEDPGLTIGDLATRMGLNAKQTSTLINQGFQQNFNDFINSYRVSEVKRRLINGEHQRFTILSIALACGFNSKTTFNRVFKRLTGQTPRQFIQELPESSTTS